MKYAFPDALNENAKALIDLCRDKNVRLSTIESCTGGLLAGCLTDIAGSSDVMDRGFVTYSNEAKMNFLGVKKSSLTNHGAVSEEVVREMSEGISHRASTEIGIAVSGIAGPDGGSREKPVGTVCFGFKYFEITETFTKFFEGDRENIRILSTEFLLVQLLAYLTTD